MQTARINLSLSLKSPAVLRSKFFKVLKRYVTGADDSEEEILEEPQAVEYMNEKDAVVSCAAKLIAHDMVPKVYIYILRKWFFQLKLLIAQQPFVLLIDANFNFIALEIYSVYLLFKRLVAQGYLGPALLSQFILHGKIVEETVKQLLTQVKKHSKLEDLSHMYLDSMKRVLFFLNDLLWLEQLTL